MLQVHVTRSTRGGGYTVWHVSSTGDTYLSGEPDDASVQQHVDSILLWLSRRPCAIEELCDDYDLTLHIACWASDTFGMHLTRDQTRLLGRLGIAIDYDGYVVDRKTIEREP